MNDFKFLQTKAVIFLCTAFYILYSNSIYAENLEVVRVGNAKIKHAVPEDVGFRDQLILIAQFEDWERPDWITPAKKFGKYFRDQYDGGVPKPDKGGYKVDWNNSSICVNDPYTFFILQQILNAGVEFPFKNAAKQYQPNRDFWAQEPRRKFYSGPYECDSLLLRTVNYPEYQRFKKHLLLYVFSDTHYSDSKRIVDKQTAERRRVRDAEQKTALEKETVRIDERMQTLADELNANNTHALKLTTTTAGFEYQKLVTQNFCKSEWRIANHPTWEMRYDEIQQANAESCSSYIQIGQPCPESVGSIFDSHYKELVAEKERALDTFRECFKSVNKKYGLELLH